MSTTKLITAIIIIGILLSIFPFKTFLNNRQAASVVTDVLHNWKENNIPKAIEAWSDREKSPPVSGLVDYKINSKVFGKKDGVRFAQITVMIIFPSNTDLPSGKNWLFELHETSIGWKIIDFRIVN